MSQAVKIKSNGEDIHILMDENADFETIADALRKKVSERKHFFEGATAKVAFKGRDLSSHNQQRLLDIITTETTMKVTLIDNITPPPPKLVAIPVPPPKPKPISIAPPNISYVTSDTAYYNGGLRSGQSIRFEGSVVIIGDVNPGSEVVADGNIVVLGALKGMAHAGQKGDIGCIVSALVLQPTQLRIAHLITYVQAPQKGKKAAPVPSIAYVKDGQVYIGEL